MKKAYIPCKLPPETVEWAAHISLIAQANAAVARYDGILETMVNPGLLLSPLTTQEAVLSSRIEGTQATLEEVLEFEAEPGRQIDPSRHADIQEIINYRTAINRAVELLEKRPICLNLILEPHSILMDSVHGENKARGQFRKSQKMKQEVPVVTRSQYAVQAIDSLFRQPIVRTTDFITDSKIPKFTAFRILNELERKGILNVLRESKGRRAAVLMFNEVIEITENIG